ncbi:PREDICTED: tumor necrosis factor receptor superfamily member 25, partial [Calidris pugnax]|uniref:tumor necrosis factor receptor superfamily member 25 n=1 Tax=Calidris pugnax TaxID=198806 RepID=UPI00071DC6E5
PTGTNWIEEVRLCCAHCPPGTFRSGPCSEQVNDTGCSPCPAGTFHAQPNTFTECQACYECDRHAFQTVLSNCSATSNVACGCEPGRFRHCLDGGCSEFSCLPCQSCPGRLVQRPCECCGTRPAGTARRSPEHQALLRGEPGGVARTGEEGKPSAPPEPHGGLLQGSQLYAVIDAVPVRRWKEFMRVLELREAEIELVELEVTHIRDQQYEMLKRWCQQTSPTLDRVFAALERMDLAGCAEALRRALPSGP